MTRALFIFLDGVGLGADDPRANPFARAQMPFLRSLLGGRRLTDSAAPFASETVSLTALDAGLGVPGLPQSATGQAALLTGVNLPAELGCHYGPKPNRQVAGYLGNGKTIFSWLREKHKTAALLNAYPPRYFDGIASGARLHSAFPLAAVNAGLRLFTQADLYAGNALSADLTGQGWRTLLGYPDAPLLSAREAGARLARLAQGYDFSLFEYWASDYAGHKQDMDWALAQLETLDGALEGLLQAWDMEHDLIVLASDHGNLEDLSTRRHTPAEVPGLVIGRKHRRFSRGLADLTGIAPRFRSLLLDGEERAI